MDRGPTVAGGVAHRADLLAGADIVAVPHGRRAQVAIDRAPAVAVNDQHRQPLPRQIVADIADPPGRRGADFRPRRRTDVDAVVALAQPDRPEPPQDVAAHRPVESGRRGDRRRGVRRLTLRRRTGDIARRRRGRRRRGRPLFRHIHPAGRRPGGVGIAADVDRAGGKKNSLARSDRRARPQAVQVNQRLHRRLEAPADARDRIARLNLIGGPRRDGSTRTCGRRRALEPVGSRTGRRHFSGRIARAGVDRRTEGAAFDLGHRGGDRRRRLTGGIGRTPDALAAGDRRGRVGRRPRRRRRVAGVDPVARLGRIAGAGRQGRRSGQHHQSPDRESNRHAVSRRSVAAPVCPDRRPKPTRQRAPKLGAKVNGNPAQVGRRPIAQPKQP